LDTGQPRVDTPAAFNTKRGCAMRIRQYGNHVA
jgi:hypothetical protein